MKIGLLTYFAADNYGATLQAYATIKAFEKLGHEVTLINFVIQEPPRSLAKNIILFPKHLKFERFRKKYFHNISRPYSSIDGLRKDPPKLDCYLVGSDQTWNPDISMDKAKGFFLDFGNDNILRASYAASWGKAEWSDTKWINKDDVKRLLSRFDFVSVREDSGLKILEKLGVKNFKQVLDPVLLFHSYHELTGKVEEKNEIVLYKLINDKGFYEQAKAIGNQLNISIRSIGSIRKFNGIQNSYPESVGGWIRQIAGAKYIITDSFHGTVIAILHHRQFAVCMGNPERLTRLESLLKLLGLSDRLIIGQLNSESLLNCLNNKIEYERIDNILDKEREKSFDFIKSIKKNKVNDVREN